MASSSSLKGWISKVVPIFVESIKRSPTYATIKSQAMSWGLAETDIKVLVWPAFQLLQEGHLETNTEIWSRMLYDLFNDKPFILNRLKIPS